MRAPIETAGRHEESPHLSARRTSTDLFIVSSSVPCAIERLGIVLSCGLN